MGVNDSSIHYRPAGWTAEDDNAVKSLDRTPQAKWQAIDAHELRDVLSKHGRWSRGHKGGWRADLSMRDLRGLSFAEIKLAGAKLAGANLSHCVLVAADLNQADLFSAILHCADLRDADLKRADLRGAHLDGANMEGADFTGADLRSGAILNADGESNAAAFRASVYSAAAFANVKLVEGSERKSPNWDSVFCCGMRPARRRSRSIVSPRSCA